MGAGCWTRILSLGATTSSSTYSTTGSKGQRGATELWAVVELGPKGSGYALDCFPDVWKDAIVARGEIEKAFKGALRKAKK